MKLSINMTVNSLIPTDDVDRKKGKGKGCYGQALLIYRQEKKLFVGAESGSYAVSSSGFSFAMQLDVPAGITASSPITSPARLGNREDSS